MAISTSDLVLLVVVGLGAVWYLFGDFFRGAKSEAAKYAGQAVGKVANGASSEGGEASGRSFVSALKKGNKRVAIFYGSQTGTAEDYATRLAKEAKQKYGISSLVCDLEEYDFDQLDQMTEEMLAIFCVATYGEGEPTDNAVAFWDFLKDDGVTFSNGESKLENLKYVVFGLGNRTYEQFCAMGKMVDERLEQLGAKRIGERGEGDDDKSMEEDYLAWKDGMWEAVQKEMGFEEGAGLDSSDFEVKEISEAEIQDKSRVFLGELSHRMLTGQKGVFDAKNPFPAPIASTRELFQAGDRNCIFAEFDIEGSGLRYQAGDHVGVWPLNPDHEVERTLRVLGLEKKAETVIEITSLDPALAKVPFPTPTTYDAIFRHYVDVCAVASRQAVGALAAFAPNDKAKQRMEKIGADKDFYSKEVADKCHTVAQVLLEAAGDNPDQKASDLQCTKWEIPFDRIVSIFPRLQPRYYSISSSPKISPSKVAITAVVLKYEPNVKNRPDHGQGQKDEPKLVYGVATNQLLNLKIDQHGDSGRVEEDPRSKGTPKYRLEGPRGKFRKESGYSVPIHIRRSNFRLPTSPKIPVIMIGPGTGVAPFRGFVQERVALARKAKEQDGPDALKNWGDICLFYGCRKEKADFLYKDEWEEYAKELDGKFKLFCAYSREENKPKMYVQKMLEEQKDLVHKCIVEQKGYAYICGDAKHMARDVEEVLKTILAQAKDGKKETGEAEYKALKDRGRLLADVWS